MVVPELDSFIRKFHQLWRDGLTAHLDLDTPARNAWVGLRVQLGHQVPGTGHHHPVHPHRSDSSRQRRCARRFAAREQVNNKVAEKAILTSEEEVREQMNNEVAEEAIIASEKEATEQVNNKVAEEAITTSEEEVCETSDTILETNNVKNDTEKVVSVEEINDVRGKATELFECPICDFSSNWKNGLEVHMGRKHNTIEQIDGSSDVVNLELDEKYDRSKHYWEKGKIGIAYHVFLDATSIIDASDIPEEEKVKEKEKILDARRTVFGSNFHQFPPWRK